MLEIQKLFKNNTEKEAFNILEKKDIKWKVEISKDTGKEYMHFDYGVKALKDDVLTKECRGIVLEKDTFDIARYGFYRFMNFGEGGCDFTNMNERDFECEEKVDGSIIILSYFDGRWVAGTRGRVFPDAKLPNGKNFEEMFWSLVDDCPFGISIYDYLNKKNCYTFELCSLENRIVVPYKKPQLVLLNVRDKFNDWKEFSSKELDDIYTYFTEVVTRPKIFKFNTILDCIEKSKELSGFEEGFVIKKWNEKEQRFYRAKIKGRAYLDLHHVVTSLSLRNLTRLALFDERETLESFPEFLEDYDIIKKEINDFHNKIWGEYEIAFNKTKTIIDEREKKKSFALALKKCDIFSSISGICFTLYKDKEKNIMEVMRDMYSSKSRIKTLVEILKLKEKVNEKWIDSEDSEEDV